jgi:hypothetical protein
MPPQDKRAKPSHKENFEGGEDEYLSHPEILILEYEQFFPQET